MSTSKRLPLIVGYGGYNAAGRSSGDLGYRRMIFESLSAGQQRAVTADLWHMMSGAGLEDAKITRPAYPAENEWAAATRHVLDGTLVRKIESALFSVDRVYTGRPTIAQATEATPLTITLPARELPDPLPFGWTLRELISGKATVEIWKSQEVTIPLMQSLGVQAAGQLPAGFDPGAYYRSTHHPRGLQLAIMAASDAMHSTGLRWKDLMDLISPDEVGVYSSSVMSQLDPTGFGGMMSARAKGQRTTSKQLALGLNTMPADFINAYVLGSIGATGGMTGACATFLYNLRVAVEDIQAGRRRVVLVGSAEAPILPEIIDGYAAMSALATDDDLRKLDGSQEVDYRRASRPFGYNCGFTLAESGQYVVLMDDELALATGASIYGAVPAVYVNADGFKKSISAPGPGNYITMAKAVALAHNLVGSEVVKHASFVQAHGSSTPQNRVTESRIFDTVAEVFGIHAWPVAAVKAYLGHSLGPASGDQLVASLGVFKYGILPGIKTIDAVADDVKRERLQLNVKDVEIGTESAKVAFLNSKGFGGNNATAAVLSPSLVATALQKRHGSAAWTQYLSRQEVISESAARYQQDAAEGRLAAEYRFGEGMIDEETLSITKEAISIPGFSKNIQLPGNEGFDDCF